MEYAAVIDGNTDHYSTGTIDDSTLDGQSPFDFIGEIVTIRVQDENGNIIEKSGILTGVL